MSESKKIPVWQIIIVFCVLVFIACIIIFTFVFSQEKWKLTAEVVTLISFLLIICAGFFFDQIQIGQISLLKREIEGKDALINSFQNFICNNQISNNNNVNPHFNIAAKIYTSEDNKKEQEEVLEENNKSISNREKNQRKQRMEMAQEDYISKYCKEKLAFYGLWNEVFCYIKSGELINVIMNPLVKNMNKVVKSLQPYCLPALQD